jgi:hypothetical protein
MLFPRRGWKRFSQESVTLMCSVRAGRQAAALPTVVPAARGSRRYVPLVGSRLPALSATASTHQSAFASPASCGSRRFAAHVRANHALANGLFRPDSKGRRSLATKPADAGSVADFHPLPEGALPPLDTPTPDGAAAKAGAVPSGGHSHDRHSAKG